MNEAYTGNASTAAWILMTLASKGMGMYTKDEIKRKSKLPDPKIYYFDVKTFQMIANKVILQDHTSFVENITFDTTTDFIFNQSRKSYRLNDNGDKTYVRATYFYDNFKTEYQ